MDNYVKFGRGWEAGFSLLDRKVTEKQEEEARMIPMVMNQGWRNQPKVMFSSIYIQIVTYINIYWYISIPGLIYSYFLAL